jgi:hypothetical protein
VEFNGIYPLPSLVMRKQSRVESRVALKALFGIALSSENLVELVEYVIRCSKKSWSRSTIII